MMDFFSFFKKHKEESFELPKIDAQDSIEKTDLSQSQFSQQSSFATQSPFSSASSSFPMPQQSAFDPLPPAQSSQSSFSPSNSAGISQMNSYGTERDNRRDAELVSAKLDTIKAMLESLTHRIATIEKSVVEKEKKETIRW